MSVHRSFAICAALAVVCLPRTSPAQSTTVTRKPTTARRLPTAAVRADTARPTVTQPSAGVTVPLTRTVAAPVRATTAAPTPAAVAPVRSTAESTRVVVAPVRAAAETTRRVSRTAASAATRAPVAAAQETLTTSRDTAARHTVSSARLKALLGVSKTPVRVVRERSVADVATGAASVSVRPSEFVFRKVADTARTVTTRPVKPPRPTVTPPVRDPAVQPTPPTPSRDSVMPPAVRTDSVVVAIPGERPVPLGDNAETYAMPYRWLTIDSAGREHVLIPYFIVLGGGLTYDVAARRYRGTALVGIEDSLATEAGSVPLARPLRLQLVVTGNGGSVAPSQLAIAHTSLDYTTVRIDSPDATAVQIRTSADPTGIVVPIRTLDMTVTLTPDSLAIEGFGLATSDVALALPRGMARTDSAVVSFESSGPSVTPSRVTVSGALGGHVRVRSSLPGTHTVRAYLDGVAVGQMTVTSTWPVTFAGGTVVGALLGGVARWVSARRRKRARALPWEIARGAPFGILAAIGSAVGLDLLNLKLDEPGALPAIVVLSAIGAWVGARVLERTSPASAASPTPAPRTPAR
jgi:hypothetical protein